MMKGAKMKKIGLALLAVILVLVTLPPLAAAYVVVARVAPRSRAAQRLADAGIAWVVWLSGGVD
jgi:hypothetical protein